MQVDILELNIFSKLFMLKEYFILSYILENKLSIFKHNKIKKEFHNHIEGNNIIIIGKDEFCCNWVCLYI